MPDSRPINVCREHSEVSEIKGRISLLLVVLTTMLGLTGYNIYCTQQIQVTVAREITKLGGQISSTNVRARASDDLIHENRVILNDHEQRIRYLESRRKD